MFVTKIALSLSGRLQNALGDFYIRVNVPCMIWRREGRQAGTISSPTTMYGQLECICSVSLGLSVPRERRLKEL